MPKKKNPRKGSMQFWPRKRAKKSYARVRSWPDLEVAMPLGFAGYKAGMTHVLVRDNKPHALTKGEEIFYPVSVIECPPIKVAGIRFYKTTQDGLTAFSDIFSKCDKELMKKIKLSKNPETEKKLKEIETKLEQFSDIRLVVYTQPKLTGIGKKKPEIFEIAMGGKIAEKFKYARDNLGKEIFVKDVFNEGEQLDIRAVTKGKGLQGPVKRFGVGIRSHKSEKTKRGPGSLGGWKAQGHVMYRIAHAGQMGYHFRTEYNKWLLRIDQDTKKVNVKGGFKGYGNVKNSYILLKGSVIGPRKRLIVLTKAIRENKLIPKEAPEISYVSLKSNQGK